MDFTNIVMDDKLINDEISKMETQYLDYMNKRKYSKNTPLVITFDELKKNHKTNMKLTK